MSKKNDQSPQRPAISEERRDLKTDLLSPIGYILGVSYPLLALSTGVRSLYQLFLKEGVTNYVGPSLSGLAAILYLVAAIGFFKRTPRWWRISVTALALETALTLLVGALSFIIPEAIGGTIWRHFGQDYGFFPLIQPLLGLAYLLWTPTKVAYGVSELEASSSKPGVHKMNSPVHYWRREQFQVSTDPRRLDLDVIHGFLTRSYWAAGISRDVVERSGRHSLCFGLYDGDRQIGFARVVGDFVRFAYLMDVFILEPYRGRGLGKWLIECVLACPDLRDVRRLLLTTADAQPFYAPLGFQPLAAPDSWMERVITPSWVTG